MSYIEVNSSPDPKSSGIAAVNDRSVQTVSVHGRNIPVRVADNQDDDSIFPYEAYLRFIEIYMKLLGDTMGDKDDLQQRCTTKQ